MIDINFSTTNFLLKIISIASCLLLVFSGTTATAITAEQRRLINQNILYYDPSSVACDPSRDDGSAELIGADAAEKVFNFFVNKPGYEDFHAAAIIGNMTVESGVQPLRLQNTGSGVETKSSSLSDSQKNDTSLGWGIVQWTPPRKVITPSVDAGKDPDKLEVQLEFLYSQLEGTSPSSSEKAAGDQFKATTNLEDAVLAFQGNTQVGGQYIGYERPADQSGSVPERTAAAKAILTLLESSSGNTVSSTGLDPCATDENGNETPGSFSEVVKDYAWEDYRPPQFVDRKPAYAEAIDKAQSEGQYIGGSVAGQKGIDCGAFVSRVLIDSGFEPEYNYSGKGGNTISQQKWLKENWQQFRPTTSGDLKPGDVAINEQHTYIFVGSIEGFNSTIASASYSTQGNGRAPMAGIETPASSSFNWYRKN